MSKIRDFIAAFGTNLVDVAFMAHFWFAASVVLMFPSRWAILSVALAAGFKEFYFDARYENPPQTFSDNALDWAGYMLGAVAAYVERTGHL